MKDVKLKDLKLTPLEVIIILQVHHYMRLSGWTIRIVPFGSDLEIPKINVEGLLDGLNQPISFSLRLSIFLRLSHFLDKVKVDKMEEIVSKHFSFLESFQELESVVQSILDKISQ